MQTILFIFELIGTAAFAVSGAFTAIEKKMDLFGVAMLGLTTAVGGGVIRDVILGAVPPAMFASPVYAVSALVCAAAVFIPSLRTLIRKRQRLYDTVLLVMDSVGLGVFSAVGVRAAVEAGFGENLFAVPCSVLQNQKSEFSEILRAQIQSPTAALDAARTGFPVHIADVQYIKQIFLQKSRQGHAGLADDDCRQKIRIQRIVLELLSRFGAQSGIEVAFDPILIRL